MKVLGTRPHLIGDTVMALHTVQAMRLYYPEAYINWAVSAKCSQAAALYLNHPAIDRIIVIDGERYGPKELELFRACDVVFDPLPQHPEGDVWPQRRNIYEETWMMAGLSLGVYNALPREARTPHLVKWFKTERRAKSVAIWPGARQGEKQKRNPDWMWWWDLAVELRGMGYTVYQCGHPNDLAGQPPLGIDVRAQSFMDLIALSLGCDMVIGTDSGSMVAIAAYGETNSLSLLCPHWPGHGEVNKMAFGPLGNKHTNMWAPTNNGHELEAVIARIKEAIS